MGFKIGALIAVGRTPGNPARAATIFLSAATARRRGELPMAASADMARIARFIASI
ncbi:hypothetical protein [Methylosinus sp. C49]|uniref:hypothetical protein n=1 Tax=Methylosinus sp. C49 TaxID=2699395 RepID=UPI00137AA453|nr:hypothetical protein [Methylosinus sp. C49]